MFSQIFIAIHHYMANLTDLQKNYASKMTSEQNRKTITKKKNFLL